MKEVLLLKSAAAHPLMELMLPNLFFINSAMKSRH